MTTIQSHQRGEGKLGVIIGLIVFLFVVFVVIKTVPIFLTVGAFNDEIISIAEGRGYDRGNNEAEDKKNIAKALEQRATKLNLLLDDENTITAERIKVDYSGNVVKIRVSYTLPIDYGLFTYEWKKEHNVQRPRFGRI